MLHFQRDTTLKTPMTLRHFIDIDDYDSETLRFILDCAKSLKKSFKAPVASRPRLAEGAVLAMLFEKTSTRTRVSFDVAMRQLGGETIVLNHSDMQLGRGETIADTARVLSRYVDIIMMRATSHETLIELAQHATVPVINGLSDRSHPCQILADILTLEEKKGPVEPLLVTWIGDGNNVAASSDSCRRSFRLYPACRHARKSSPPARPDQLGSIRRRQSRHFRRPPRSGQGS